MKEKEEGRTKWLHIRLTPGELEKIQKFCSSSTCQKLSEYSRRILLNKPVTVKYKNQSLDDFMAEMILLRKELNAIGNNFNQAVKRLHVLQSIQDYRTWVLMNESTKEALMKKVDEIKNKINSISDIWLQK